MRRVYHSLKYRIFDTGKLKCDEYMYYLKHEKQGLIKIENGLKIGRKNADILFRNDEFMSSTHCQFRIVKGKLYIIDLSSKNGTIINAEKVAPEVEYLIMPGTSLEVGDQKFQIIQK